jgi:F0F1-type ATP synthase assembly protein I
VSEKPVPSVFNLASMGFAAALLLALGLGVGYWLDGVLHTGAVFTFVGLGVGVVAAVASTYFSAKRYL